MWLCNAIKIRVLDLPRLATFVVSLFAFLFLASCSVHKFDHEKWLLAQLKSKKALSTGITGVCVIEAESGKPLCGLNADRFFVPASNVKIISLWAVLTTMKDTLPFLRYSLTDSTLHLWGTANPAFLHPYFNSEKVLQQLRSMAIGKKVFLSQYHARLSRFGPGWMWDDYAGYYQPELSSFPVHGNALFIQKDSSGLTIMPSGILKDTLYSGQQKTVGRPEWTNRFILPTALDTIATFYQEIPYFNADSVNRSLLAVHLNQAVFECTTPIAPDAKPLYGIETDTVCRRMMQVSDNMLADHLLLGCGMQLADTLDLEAAITMLSKRFPAQWPHLPVWVDGSGLSRYNLFTPWQMVSVLGNMYHTFPHGRLMSLFAKGGQSGTLRKLFANEQQPYVFGKSGSMSGVYNLSGYLRARSGKWLVFSIMSNNICLSVADARTETAELIEAIRKKY